MQYNYSCKSESYKFVYFNIWLKNVWLAMNPRHDINLSYVYCTAVDVMFKVHA